MNKNEVRLSLCGGDKCCPEVAVNTKKAEVTIGEEGNLVTLDRRAWNTLVELITTGELKQI